MATVTITAPYSQLQGERGGLHFINGQAEADTEKNEGAIAYFVQAGYTVEGLDTPTPEGVEVITPLDKMPKADLILLAAQRGVVVPEGAKVADLRALLGGRDGADLNEQPAETATVTDEQLAGATYTVTPATTDGDNEDAQGVQH